MVRRWMRLPDEARTPRVSRLLEVLTPEDAERTPEFTQHYAVFDFSAVSAGLQGYLWDFPSYVNGQPMMNRGVFDARILPDRPRAALAPLLEAYLQARQRVLADYELQGHPERYYDPTGVYSVPHILLVGDAAGVDPLLGEGIAWALRYGPVAARQLKQAFASGDLSFAGYSQALATSDVGRGLTQRVHLARFAYGGSPGFIRLAWPLMGPASRFLARRAQREQQRSP
jgi:flavin-dependent dehydrogenase